MGSLQVTKLADARTCSCKHVLTHLSSVKTDSLSMFLPTSELSQYVTACPEQVLKVLRYASKLLIAQGTFDGAAHFKLEAIDSSLGATRCASWVLSTTQFA